MGGPVNPAGHQFFRLDDVIQGRVKCYRINHVLSNLQYILACLVGRIPQPGSQDHSFLKSGEGHRRDLVDRGRIRPYLAVRALVHCPVLHQRFCNIRRRQAALPMYSVSPEKAFCKVISFQAVDRLCAYDCLCHFF